MLHPSAGTGDARSTPAARRLLWAAAGVGLVHAAFSLYWALGGRWLLATVGPWAVHLADTAPLAGALALALVAAVKVAAAAVPLLNNGRRLPAPRLWWRLCALGAAVLVLYGGANTVAGLAELSGLLHPHGGYDHAAMLGHAALWDPLFLAWGLLLAWGLALRRGPASGPRG